MNLTELKSNLLVNTGEIEVNGMKFQIRELTGYERCNLANFYTKGDFANATAYSAGASIIGDDKGHLFDPDDETKRKEYMSLPDTFVVAMQTAINKWQESKQIKEIDDIKK